MPFSENRNHDSMEKKVILGSRQYRMILEHLEVSEMTEVLKKNGGISKKTYRLPMANIGTK